jgi:hypothetical protein
VTTPPRTNQRRRRWLAAAALLLVAVVCHRPLLRGAANFLVVDARFAEIADVAPVKNDPESLELAASLYTAGRAAKIVILPGFPRRTDELGITEPFIDEIRRDLAAHSVAERDVEILPTAVDDLAERVRALADHVRTHPERRLMLTAGRFQGRFVRYVAREGLDDAARERIAVASAEPTQFDERRWWTNRPAIQQVFQGYLSWLVAGWMHLPERNHRPIDVAAFEAALAEGRRP